MLNNLINVDDVLVNKEILETKFTCDLDKCKGACCTMESDFGAPLLKEEIDKINEVLPKVKKYLSERQIKEIETKGFHFEIDGELMVSAIDNQDCVFAFYHGDIAKCAIEKVYYDEVMQRAVSKFIPAEELVVPYYASDLMECERITHVIKMGENEKIKKQASGFYRDIELKPTSAGPTQIEKKYHSKLTTVSNYILIIINRKNTITAL